MTSTLACYEPVLAVLRLSVDNLPPVPIRSAEASKQDVGMPLSPPYDPSITVCLVRRS
jgi:hypothetical protein